MADADRALGRRGRGLGQRERVRDPPPRLALRGRWDPVAAARARHRPDRREGHRHEGREHPARPRVRRRRPRQPAGRPRTARGHPPARRVGRRGARDRPAPTGPECRRGGGRRPPAAAGPRRAAVHAAGHRDRPDRRGRAGGLDRPGHPGRGLRRRTVALRHARPGEPTAGGEARPGSRVRRVRRVAGRGELDVLDGRLGPGVQPRLQRRPLPRRQPRRRHRRLQPAGSDHGLGGVDRLAVVLLHLLLDPRPDPDGHAAPGAQARTLRDRHDQPLRGGCDGDPERDAAGLHLDLLRRQRRRHREGAVRRGLERVAAGPRQRPARHRPQRGGGSGRRSAPSRSAPRPRSPSVRRTGWRRPTPPTTRWAATWRDPTART